MFFLKIRALIKKILFFIALTLFLPGSASAQSSAWWNDVENDRRTNVMQELASGADPNVRNDDGQPAIMMAIQHQSWQVYDLLRQHRRTDINAVNSHDETPLMYLALMGEYERMQQLIQQGAKVRRLGWTPLHYAASKGQVKAARLLLDNGALVNSPAPDGTTPLMMAALAGSRPAAELLLNEGADINAVNLQGLEAADWARSKSNTQLANYLDEYKKAIHTPATQPNGGDIEGLIQNDSDSTGSVDGSDSSSRYFDLDRFDQPVAP
ncbi:ankyrin repeat domain-containing protein [Paenalcaligenes niemegkensis]|uniref:ankyrin repeat domain-containing protein n=1 Tax=Paenalcaligenes niemegkensis TaxID=2895469 RepID=UPI001EE7F9AD|nr:ankyrin repeat domain-containing protein [Paenalcaligenes niemegkensis]MCQ9616308.1 ankyrin repeat domain-containing protein [Paenalcaligenes niemegkensis]